MSDQQRATIRRDAKELLAQAFVMFPVLLLALAWVIWWARACRGTTWPRAIWTMCSSSWCSFQMYLVAVMAGPVILCYLSEPTGARLAMWTFTAIFFPQVVQLLEAAGVHTIAQRVPLTMWWFTAIVFPKVIQFLKTLSGNPTAQPVLTPPGGVRFAIGPQPPIPALRFHPPALPLSSNNSTPPIHRVLRFPFSRGHRMGCAFLFRNKRNGGMS